jgi:hypothetical protein
MPDDRPCRKVALGVAAALSTLALATLVSPRSAVAQHNDAYSPPPDERSYLQPLEAPASREPGASPWAPSTESGAPGSHYGDRSRPPQNSAMRGVVPAPVEKDNLAPVMSSDGSGLPYELWRGVDVPSLEKLIASIQIPPRSPALHKLWTRLITSTSVDSSNAAFSALRLEALYRSGLARDAAAEIAKQPVGDDPLLLTLAARNELASGHSDKACESVARVAGLKGNIPPRFKGLAILMAGYCSAVRGDDAGAGLAADMAREEGVESSPGLEALYAISIKAKPKFTPSKTITLLDYKIAERVGGLPHKAVLEKGEPALLAALATDPSTPIDLGLPATEAAARLNALTPETLAAIYRVNAQTAAPDALLSGKGGPQGVARRAALFKAAETEQNPMVKTRLIRTFLDESKHEGLFIIAAKMIAPATATLIPAPELSWFAETGVEIGLAAGRYDMARTWIALSDQAGGASGSLDYWRALIDIADENDPHHGQSLPVLESYTGRFAPEALQRLATVLVALDYVVPIPLWEAANRAPQSTSGYLPETGVLTELQNASKKQEFGHTVLLVMKALGPNGAADANLIALGDSIRALKRAGLEADARRLGLEALLGSWPRTATN